MIRLGLRLTLNGGREAVVRLVISAAAVALGVGMLLITLAGINAVNSQNARFSWLETGTAAAETPTSPHVDPAWWYLTGDLYQGEILGRVDVATTGATSPVPPGVDALPGPGEFYASPALAKLLHDDPHGPLATRYPGRQIGIIGPAALPAPSSLIAIVGHTPEELSQLPGATEVTAIGTTVPSSCNGDCYFIGIDARGIDLILSITAAAILCPVLVFIATATRLSAARREQRFAAMRLVGATPRQISVIAAVESTAAAVFGVAGGFLLFAGLRHPLAAVPFTGTRFYLSDISLNRLDVLAVAVGVPIAAAVAARLALRRVSISPLGVTRRATPRPPSAYRIIPLLLGVAELSYFVAVGRPATTPGQIQAFLTGFLLIMVGLVIAGPWFTMLGARLVADRTGRPAALIAARRLADNPQAGFRAVAGLVLALFVTSVAVTMITTINAYGAGGHTTVQQSATLVEQYHSQDGSRSTAIPAIPATLIQRLKAIPGVQAVSVVHQMPSDDPRAFPPGVASCAALAEAPALGHCADGASVATVEAYFGGRDSTQASTVWPASSVPAAQLERLPVELTAVVTDGSTDAIEGARTLLEQAHPSLAVAATIGELNAQNPNTKLNKQYQQLADVVILTSLPIAGCALAVSVATGLSDRRRPFSLLRLTGAPLGMLRRVVALESAVPMIALATVSIGVGFLASGLFLKAQLTESLRAPGMGYYLIVLSGLVASLVIVACTFPLLERITGPEASRNE
ncbi:FtsX-like permease family protein [Jatrophihabitans sp. GAS493]|uniref:FtsX-like permease family protein n=1 Tax=Jatrophihabitans sp. GAS493 TaxID=1907575 RepID=UPI000BB8CA5C|nr:ABC transporter permease [Jatrophihabitans sp. GAS493]SOD72798.1 FtsX-like permease family protein [Jatrophihabitans sp. GAS493]